MTICNFTDSYKKLDERLTGCTDILDFTDLKECSGYCSDEAADQIRERIRDRSAEGVRYIDDGNHHYLSKLWMEKIREPFDLCVFDHHNDMQAPGLLPFLSCGSWIRDSINGLIFLNDVYLIGIPEDVAVPSDLPSERIFVIREEEANSGELYFPKSALPLYVSVDLDVLAEDEFRSIWDQGSMKMKRLMDWIRYLKTRRRAIAVDFCG